MPGVYTDWTGKRVGKLLVVNKAENSKGNKSRWHCICDCGKETIVHAVSLKSQNTKSCGCLRGENIIDLIGKKFGRLTVIKRLENNKDMQRKWLCLCDCGNEKVVLGVSLRQNHTLSCGCYKNELIGKRMKTHGHASLKNRSPEYKIWAQMKTRCSNPNAKQYEDYGGRGVQVCEKWLNSFESFFEDMGPRPSRRHSIDRIKVDGNYEPSNCKWSTATEQNHNRRIARNNKSGCSGVKWIERIKKWEVSISNDNKRVYLGVHSNLEDAISVRKEAELRYWGKSS